MENINITAIRKFIQRYEKGITSQSREIKLSIEEAGLLSAALNDLLTNRYFNLINELKSPPISSKEDEKTVELNVAMDGGDFFN